MLRIVYRQILYPHRTDAGIISEAEATCPPEAGICNIRQACVENISPFDKGDNAEFVGQAGAQLHSKFQNRPAADRIAVRIKRPDRLIGIPADGTAAT